MSEAGWIDREEYPFESHYIDLPAGRMHYVDEGRGDAVLMLHGNPTWSFLYRHLIKRLRRDYRCIAPDYLGFGLSDKPTDWSYLPEGHNANLAALVEALRLERITLVVQDWGGPIGLSYAVAHPKKVVRLIIMNTWSWPVNRDPYYIAFSLLMGGPIGRYLIRRYNFFAETVMPQGFGDRAKLTKGAHEQYLFPLSDPQSRRGCMVFPRQIVGSTEWLRGVWGKISVLREKPVLIVWGGKDIAFKSKERRRWERTFPGAKSILLDSVGHFVPEEAPEDLAQAAASFLRETSPIVD